MMSLAKPPPPIPGVVRGGAAVLGLGILLGYAGPFATYPVLECTVRFAFWIGLVSAGALAALAAGRILRATALTRGWPRFAKVAATTLTASLPMTFVVAWVLTLVQPGRVIPPASLVGLFWAVASIQLAVVLLVDWPAGPDQEAEPTPPRPTRVDRSPPAFPQSLLARLPANFDRNILALESEDHYVRVHTASGSAIVLMSLADASAALDERLGLRVHRRWWVARGGVEGLRRDGQRILLNLANGLSVPVGRTYLAAVRASMRSDSGPWGWGAS